PADRRQWPPLQSTHKNRSELRHARSEPRRIRQAARVQAGGGEGGLREDLQLTRGSRVLDDAAFRNEQDSHDRTDQGRGRAADEPGQSGEYGEVASWPGLSRPST